MTGPAEARRHIQRCSTVRRREWRSGVVRVVAGKTGGKGEKWKGKEPSGGTGGSGEYGDDPTGGG